MNWPTSWLLWVDANPVRYWTLAWAAFGLTVIGAFATSGKYSVPARLAGRLLFAGSLLLTLAAFRWPTWFVPDDLNPDEAQMIAGAITLRHFPVYWKFVDGGTHGPFCELPLLAASLLGAPPNYVTARIVAALLQATSLIAVWGTVRCFASERLARLAVLPGLAFWAFVWFHDYVHYSSELAGLWLLALAGWGLAHVLTTDSPGLRESWLIYGSGLALGAIPLAKLQSVPQAAALAATALTLLWRGSAALPRWRWRLAGCFVAGGVSVPVLTLAFLWLYGLGGQFWASYVLNNIAYSNSGHPLGEMPGRFLDFSIRGYSFAWFFAGTLAAALFFARATPGSARRLRTATAISWLMLGLAFASVILPGKETPHYLHLLVIPATLVAGLSLAAATEGASGQADRGDRAWGPAGWFVLLALVPQIHYRAVAAPEFLGQLSAHLSHRQSDAARYIAQRAGPTDTLAMWGWEPNLFVQSGLAQGTRYGNSAFQVAAIPLQPFYVGCYLADMRRRRPDWFVDAVGPDAFMYEDRSVYGHERTTELRDLIAERYELLTEIKNLRVYRLKSSARP